MRGGLEQLLVQEAVAEPGERAPLVAQDVHGHGPPAAELADDAVGGHVHVVERHLGQLVGAVRLLDGRHLDAGRAEVDDEGGEAAVARLARAGAGQHEAPRRVPGPARPDLAAVDDEAVRRRGGRWCAGWPGPSRRPGSEKPCAQSSRPARNGGQGLGDERRAARWATSVGARISRCSNSAIPGTPWRASASHMAAAVQDRPAEPADLDRPPVPGPARVVERAHQAGHRLHPLLVRRDRAGRRGRGSRVRGEPRRELVGVGADVEPWIRWVDGGES